jgi:hypothetical protein
VTTVQDPPARTGPPGGVGAEAKTLGLRIVIDTAGAAGLFDHTAHVRLIDALEHPESAQARRAGLLELANWHADWQASDLDGPATVAMLRQHFAPACTPAIWELICDDLRAGGDAAGRCRADWHDRAIARHNLDFWLDRAVGLIDERGRRTGGAR